MEVRILPELTEEQQRTAHAALTRREDADYQCFLLLREAQQWIGTKPDADDREELDELRERVEEALKERNDANEEFMRAVLGR